MYIPPAFLESDLPTLHELIERHGFGLLVSRHDGSPFATHLPLLLDRSSGTLGTLLGHVARGLVEVLRHGGVHRHEAGDATGRDPAVAGGARHGRVDLRDHGSRSQRALARSTRASPSDLA